MFYRLCFMSLSVLICATANSQADDPPQRRALLVGVTAYPNVGKNFQLRGGTNDAAVVERVLVEKFGFRPEEIVVLTEVHGRNDESRLPTKKNIEAAISKLVAGIRNGDQVVVFLAGHGTELPTADGPRGYFLPRDVAPWKGEAESGSVPNAIAGTEIGTWLRPIAEKQASLWVIVDACFTGRMVRGGAGAVRQLPTDPDITGGLQVPHPAVRADAKRGTGTPNQPIPLPNHAGVACLYACSPNEVTLEERAAAGDTNAPVLGLLTRALGDVLLNASSELSYRELHGRITKFYASTGRSSPTPIIEGAAINRTILQSKVLRKASIIINESDDGDLVINAGLLHGLTVGSVMAVYPLPGQGDMLKGYVKLTRLGSVTAECQPHAEAVGLPAKKASLIGGRAEVLRIEYEDILLPVAIDLSESGRRTFSVDQLAELRKLLKTLSAEKNATFRVTDSLADARLLIQCQGDGISLVPVLLQSQSTTTASNSVHNHKIDKVMPSWLRTKLDHFSRAHALLRLHMDRGRDSAVKISTELVKLKSRAITTGDPIDGAVKSIRPGDFVAYEIKNHGESPVDITILYLDSSFAIRAIFPTNNEANRVLPGKLLRSPIFRVNDRTVGTEYAVVIAVENLDKGFIELTALAPSHRSVTASAKQLDTPLGRLLDQSRTEQGGKRSAPQNLIRSYTVELMTLHVERD